MVRHLAVAVALAGAPLAHAVEPAVVPLKEHAAPPPKAPGAAAASKDAAQEAASAKGPPASPLPLSLPLLEAPRSFDLGFRFPTWEQAMSLHQAVILGGNHAIHVAAWHLLGKTPFWAYFAEMAATFALDYGVAWLPLGQGWLHEEGHASAMGIAGLNTRQVFNPGSGCDDGSVCGLTDEGIAAVHDRRTADWIRVQEAGMEADLDSITRVERAVFFYDRPAYQHVPYLVFQVVNVAAYRHVCTVPGTFGIDDVLAENPDIDKRDFTGPDCTGWVYDLFRPAAPYSARGPHPLGGVRRFRLIEDLSAEERAYLGRMRNLSLLNLVDPFLFGISGFQLPWPAGSPLRVNGAVRHHLTETGDLLELTLLARREPWKVEAALRAYSNQSRTFPGLAVQVHRYPLSVPLPFSKSLFASAGVSLWMQPRDHAFSAAEGSFGGAIQLEGAVPVLSRGEVFLRLRAKTAGWMVADPALDAAVNASLGVNVIL